MLWTVNCFLGRIFTWGGGDGGIGNWAKPKIKHFFRMWSLITTWQPGWPWPRPTCSRTPARTWRWRCRSRWGRWRGWGRCCTSPRCTRSGRSPAHLRSRAPAPEVSLLAVPLLLVWTRLLPQLRPAPRGGLWQNRNAQKLFSVDFSSWTTFVLSWPSPEHMCLLYCSENATSFPPCAISNYHHFDEKSSSTSRS